MKINIQVFSYPLNNFTYLSFVHLVWPKCSNYVMNVKNKSRFSIIQKQMHNSIPIQARRMKINIQVFPYLLYNFTYTPFAHLVWPKCSSYVVKVKNKSCFSIIQKMHNSISIQARHTKINIQVFPYLLNNFT